MSAGVVINQPGSGNEKKAAFEMITAPPPQIVMPQGLPMGLAYLASLDEVRIHQILEMLEVVLGWEKNNKYSICNNAEQQFMFAKEDTDCCTRQMCGTGRPFVMNITDNQGMNMIQLHRPLRCKGSCMWCCCLQEMEIHSPPGLAIGTIKEIWTCWQPRYQIYDGNDQPLFLVVGDFCWCKCCDDVVFKIYSGEAETQEIGTISKHWGGCREVCGGANDFTLRFPPQMDVLHKAILLGATYLIDFNYFEINRSN